MTSLGPCCACRGESGQPATVICMLNAKAPIPGRGWGCVGCHLPTDGALAVVCEPCATAGAELVDACRGYPGEDGRIPIGDLRGEHDHDAEAHAHD